MSTGVKIYPCTVPLTASKYVCLVCGKELLDIKDIGWKQLDQGYKKEEVFQWVNK